MRILGNAQGAIFTDKTERVLDLRSSSKALLVAAATYPTKLSKFYFFDSFGMVLR